MIQIVSNFFDLLFEGEGENISYFLKKYYKMFIKSFKE